MRRATNHGPCADCGTTVPGLYWEDYVTAVDVGGGPAVLADVASPVRCDDCELRRRIAQDVAAGYGWLWHGFRPPRRA